MKDLAEKYQRQWGDDSSAEASSEALFDPDFGETSLGRRVQEIFKPGDDLWFAYVDVRSIYNRYGDLIGYVDSDGVTLRSTPNSRAIAHQVGGIFYTPDGDVWGVTSSASVQSQTESEEELVYCD